MDYRKSYCILLSTINHQHHHVKYLTNWSKILSSLVSNFMTFMYTTELNGTLKQFAFDTCQLQREIQRVYYVVFCTNDYFSSFCLAISMNYHIIALFLSITNRSFKSSYVFFCGSYSFFLFFFCFHAFFSTVIFAFPIKTEQIDKQRNGNQCST